MNKSVALVAILLLSQFTIAQRVPKRALVTTPASTDARVENALAGFQGRAWIYAKNLEPGILLIVRDDPHVVDVDRHRDATAARVDDADVRTEPIKRTGFGSDRDRVRNTTTDAVL